VQTLLGGQVKEAFGQSMTLAQGTLQRPRSVLRRAHTVLGEREANVPKRGLTERLEDTPGTRHAARIGDTLFAGARRACREW
jgi:hypothetical protein